MDIIILAGGKSTRMEDNLPKPLVKAKGKEILSHQLDYFFGFSEVEKVVLSLGHLSSKVIDFVKEKYPDKNIEFAIEETPLGTGGGMKLAMSKTTSEFVIALNCDDLTDINLVELSNRKTNCICVAHPRLPFGRVLEKDGFAEFDEKPLLDDWVSCGWYLFNRSELMKLLPDKGSIEYEVFPKMKLLLFKHEGLWKPLNSKKDIKEFEES